MNHWNREDLPKIGSHIKLVSKDLSISPRGDGYVTPGDRTEKVKSLQIGLWYEVQGTDRNWAANSRDGIRAVRIKHQHDQRQESTWMVLGDFIGASIPAQEHSVTPGLIDPKAGDLVQLMEHHKFPTDGCNYSQDNLKLGEIYRIGCVSLFSSDLAIYLYELDGRIIDYGYPITGFKFANAESTSKPVSRTLDPANMILDPVVKAKILSAPLIRIGEPLRIRVHYDGKVTAKKIAHISASHEEFSI
jgi:hypothetical protein